MSVRSSGWPTGPHNKPTERAQKLDMRPILTARNLMGRAARPMHEAGSGVLARVRAGAFARGVFLQETNPSPGSTSCTIFGGTTSHDRR